MTPFRYVLFAAVGVVVAAAILLVLHVFVNASREASTGLIERWIVNATCDTYELTGTIRNPNGSPVAFAIVEAAYLDERLSTRSGADGRFRIVAQMPVCNRQPRNVTVTVVTEGYRPQYRMVPFEQTTFDTVLQPNDF